tara:strand:- start:168 stop:944 length:777 start_codon:yes stop_codon:yes gene_type:complete
MHKNKLIDLKKFDYEFDLNGFYILRNVLKTSDISKINKILENLEKSKNDLLPKNVFFGKKIKGEAYICNILEADKIFEKLATTPIILKLIKRVTGNSNFFRLNHAVAMTKFKKKTYTDLHMGNIPHHPKIFYFVKDKTIFSNMTKVLFPIKNNKIRDGGFSAIPGSHKSNFKRPYNNHPKNNKLLKHINIEPGDAVIFTEALAHGSLENESGLTRRILSYAYSVRYMPDWTKFNLSYSDHYLKNAPKKIKKLILLKKD